MGRATRWLKSLLGMKKEKPNKENNASENGRREKVSIERRWSFTKHQSKQDSEKENNRWVSRDYITETEKEQSKHAIAVAAATAAAADAAVAAAQAAVAVVRLTSHGRGAMFPGGRERWAAVKIQTLFRGYLARKALRALRGLVKLQAHVRGYLVRKRAAVTLQSMQALIRAQATARSQRANRAPNKSNKLPPEFRHRKSIEKFDETRSEFHSKRLSTSYHEPCNAYEGSPKIVEIDTYYKPRSRSRSRRINPTMYDFSGEDYYQYPTMSSPLPSPVPAAGRLSMPGTRNFHQNDYEWSFYGDEYRLSTAQSTPRGFSNSNSIRPNGPLTPTKSVCGDSFFRPHNFPSYMADTHSFRAKLRSQSAPKQRPEARPKKKLTLDEIMAARNSISGVRMQRSSSQVQDGLNF